MLLYIDRYTRTKNYCIITPPNGGVGGGRNRIRMIVTKSPFFPLAIAVVLENPISQ